MITRTVLSWMVLSLAVSSPLAAQTPKAWVTENLDDLVAVYRHFHANPELSLHEAQTAARLAAELKAAGAEVTAGVGGHGVVALLRNGDGPTVMLRTDLDALPVAEKTGLPYASRVKVRQPSGVEVGVMHACGHDVHITNLIGVARYLSAHKPQWRGTLVMIGQPDEEQHSLRAPGDLHRLGEQGTGIRMAVE